jgi:hypothetical protein
MDIKKFSIKNKILITSLITLASVFLIITFTSCSGKTSTSTGSSDKTAQESTNNDIVQEEVVGSIPEEDLTDYDNAKVGAEIKGAIPGFLCTNKDNYITIEIKNTSDFTWRIDSRYPVKVGYHYYGQDVDASDYDGTSRTFFEKNVEPGETVKVNVLVNDVKQPGNYVLQIDLVLEGKYWFSSKDVKMLESQTYFGECSN